ncbi:hypothetical protein VTL71DRAFT_15317 [Oculimacula yallundae]|uniref:Aminoglycoside phosphotransferase domain-containing protein n=1 Tax=Oculimacula yallundae TaxID=86028 RepID=A0ABR4CG81_9HELO
MSSGTNSQSLNIAPETYVEESSDEHEEPRKRGIRIVLSTSGFRWHIQVYFLGRLSPTSSLSQTPKRQADLIDLCRCIDFDEMELLENVVTEFVITHLDQSSNPLRLITNLEISSHYASITDDLRYQVKEAINCVQFPSYIGDGTLPPRDLSEIREMYELTPGKYRVRVRGDETWYIYKEIEIPYNREVDGKNIEQQLKILERLRDVRGIVQLIAPVVSKNPYMTATTDSAIVLRGFLLEHHSKETLYDAVKSPHPEYPWYHWAFQIARSLANLHCAGITDVDLDLKNIKISTDLAFVTIDICGSGSIKRATDGRALKTITATLSRPAKPQTITTLTSTIFTKSVDEVPRFNDIGINLNKKWVSQRIHNEVTALKLIGERTTIPVPKVLDVGHDINGTYFIAERVQGVNLREVKSVCRQSLENGLIPKGHTKRCCKACEDIAVRNAESFITQIMIPQLKALRSSKTGLNGTVIPSPWVTESDRRHIWPCKTSPTPCFVFCHGDLGPQNILCDPRTLQVSYVVDWENAGYFEEEFLQLWRVKEDQYYSLYQDEAQIARQIAQLEGE